MMSMLINVSKVHNVFEIQTGLERGQEAVVLVEPAGMRHEGRSVEPAGRERSGQRRKRIMIRRRRSISGSGFVKVLRRRRVLVVEDDGGRPAAADGEPVAGKRGSSSGQRWGWRDGEEGLAVLHDPLVHRRVRGVQGTSAQPISGWGESSNRWRWAETDNSILKLNVIVLKLFCLNSLTSLKSSSSYLNKVYLKGDGDNIKVLPRK